MATTIIFNACIITMNEGMEVIINGSIRVEDNQIKEIREGKSNLLTRSISMQKA